MGEEVLSKLVEFVESASPIIWETARRQVAVNLVQSTVWMILCAVVAYACIRWSKHFGRKYQENKRGDDDIPALALGLGAAAAIVAVVSLLTYIAGMAVNPNYYAIRLLLGCAQ